jgi:anti-sigma B factor antagonist
MSGTDWKVNKGVARLLLEGDVDLATATEIEGRLREFEQDSPPLLVVDLRGVTFLDSTGLRLIISADRRARQNERRLVLVRGRESVDRVFRLALLDSRLEFVDDPAGLDVS